MPLVIAEAFAGCRSGSPHPGQQPPPGRGVLPRPRARGPAGVLRTVDKLDKIGPEKVAALLVEAGATEAQARLPRAGRDPHRTSVSSTQVRALGVTHPTARRRARRAGRGHRGRRGAGPGHCSSPTCRSPEGSTTTPAPSTRPSWSGTRRGARSAPAGGTTRSPRTAARPTRASASRSG